MPWLLLTVFTQRERERKGKDEKNVHISKKKQNKTKKGVNPVKVMDRLCILVRKGT